MLKNTMLAAAASLLATGCATTRPAPAPPTPVEAAIAANKPQQPLASEVVVQRVLPAFICPDGQRVELNHDVPAGVMRVARGDESWVLQEQVRKGDSAPSFVTGEDTLTLYQGQMRVELQRGNTKRMICQQVPAEPAAGAIWGTLGKLDRMALAPGSRARILLVDAARAGAPQVEIASTTITTVGNQVPLHYLIGYDPDRAPPRGMTYRLQARIESPTGELLYITDTAAFVLESAAPQQPVDLMLVRTGRTRE